MTDNNMRLALSEVLKICKFAYSENTRDGYDTIDAILSEVEQTDKVTKVRRLCTAGQNTISPRFAYPHIESIILDD